MKLLNIAHFHRSRLFTLFEPAGASRLTTMISGAQIRAARGLLGWARHELARRAVVSDATVYALKHTLGRAASMSTLAAVQMTLEAEGIEFLEGDAPGLRLTSEKAEMTRPRPPTEAAHMVEAGKSPSASVAIAPQWREPSRAVRHCPSVRLAHSPNAPPCLAGQTEPLTWRSRLTGCAISIGFHGSHHCSNV